MADRSTCEGCGKRFWISQLTPADDDDDRDLCPKCWDKNYDKILLKVKKMVKVMRGKYKREHGKFPYGLGRWAFEIGGKNYWFHDNEAILYSEAKKLAIEKAKTLNVLTITVLP